MFTFPTCLPCPPSLSGCPRVVTSIITTLDFRSDLTGWIGEIANLILGV